MANWCNNRVAFKGSAEATQQVKKLFKAMAEKQKAEEVGQLPCFITKDTGYFFDIYWDYDDDGVFHYETKWSPNIEVIKKIAEHYKVNFTHDYEELGCLIFGRATYENSVLTDVHLEDEDWNACSADEETDIYRFENKIYESYYAVLEILLERKINNPVNNIKN